MVGINATGVMNLLLPVTKLCISKVGVPNSRFYVLFNPADYVLERKAGYCEAEGVDRNMASIQFVRGSCAVLTLNLFFDTQNADYSAAKSVMGMIGTGIMGALPSYVVAKDVRNYTEKVFSLMEIDPSLHVPPVLKLEWGSLQFTCCLVSCQQKFTLFNNKGIPLRAVLTCAFKQYVQPKEGKGFATQSPDTSKYMTLQEGDALWAIANREYGDSEEWRTIAGANGIVNPRTLESGKLIGLPALV